VTRKGALAGCLLAAGTPAVAQAQRAARVELPIRAVTLTDGVRRYSVTIAIGGKAVEAGLDTGSTGLRVLPAALPQDVASAQGAPTRYHYGSGVLFAGATVTAQLSFGAMVGKAKIARIDQIGCVERQPDCPAAAISPASYGILGDGLAGQGFQAIVGIGFASDPIPNPLIAIGVERWIVELPRPGDIAPGRLILNPAENEVARYKQFDLMKGGNLIAGCIVAEQSTRKLCAPAILDSGANGLRVQGGKPDDVLPQGTPALLTIGDRAGTVSMPVVIGSRDQAAGMRLYPPRDAGGLTFNFGIAPYFRWSVLYNARDHRIGIAER